MTCYIRDAWAMVAAMVAVVVAMVVEMVLRVMVVNGARHRVNELMRKSKLEDVMLGV